MVATTLVEGPESYRAHPWLIGGPLGVLPLDPVGGLDGVDAIGLAVELYVLGWEGPMTQGGAVRTIVVVTDVDFGATVFTDVGVAHTAT